MEIWQIVLIVIGALALLTVLVTVYFFQFAIIRKKNDEGVKNNVGTNWDQYFDFIHEAKGWLEQQNPEQIFIKSRDGLKLRGQYLSGGEQAQTLILCFHGYKSQGMNEFAALARYYNSLGCDALLVDDRAHGASEGKYIGFGCLDRWDCLEWTRYVNERFKDSRKVFLHGISMGAATVMMASNLDLAGNVCGIIADCGFTSAWDVFTHILKRDYHMPPFPIMYLTSILCKLFAGYGFRDVSTLDTVAQTKIPMLFIHGEDDDFVPAYMSPANYKVCNSEKELLTVPGASHAESYYKYRQKYESTVYGFLTRHGAELKQSSEQAQL